MMQELNKFYKPIEIKTIPLLSMEIVVMITKAIGRHGATKTGSGVEMSATISENCLFAECVLIRAHR